MRVFLGGSAIVKMRVIGALWFATFCATVVAKGDRSFGEEELKKCPLYPKHQKFKEPAVAHGTLTLSVEPKLLCSPRTGQRWYTRAYGAPSHGLGPSVPGVTIRVKPGDTIHLTLQNKLGSFNPTPEQTAQVLHSPASKKAEMAGFYAKNMGYPNTTNLHTHGLHISPQENASLDGKDVHRDSIFVEVPPGATAVYHLKVREDHLCGTHWYHPHHHHSTSLQAGGGMHGALIVECPEGSLPPEMANMEEKLAVISLVDLRRWNQSIVSVGTVEHGTLGRLGKNLVGPHAGNYVQEPHVYALVNGQYRPRLKIQAGKWIHWRLVFASVELLMEIIPQSQSGMECEMQLLAKDGIWLNTIPRKIDRIYMASGNRADVAIRCSCNASFSCEGRLTAIDTNADYQSISKQGGLLEILKRVGAGEDPTDPFAGVADIDRKRLVQELVFLKVEPAPDVKPVELKPFTIRRPCYLVDLRKVLVPPQHWGRVDFWTPFDYQTPGGEWRVTWTDWFTRFKGASMIEAGRNSTPLFELKVGEVYSLYVRGPNHMRGGIAEHPLHLHSVPFQIVSLFSATPYYMVGDWHDTLIHTAGQAVIRLQTDTFTGQYIIHCHLLAHEDMGMMSYFKVAGKEGTVWKDAEKYDPQCYRTAGKATWKYGGEADTQLPLEPYWVKGPAGQDCHFTCSMHGGCLGWGWPESVADFTSITLKMRNQCVPSVQSTAAPWNPSYDFGGQCNWQFKSLISVPARGGQFRCGHVPPSTVARFCPCAKAAFSPANSTPTFI